MHVSNQARGKKVRTLERKERTREREETAIPAAGERNKNMFDYIAVISVLFQLCFWVCSLRTHREMLRGVFFLFLSVLQA